MSSRASQASWHPAFMPNSISELPQKDHGRIYHTNLAQSRTAVPDAEISSTETDASEPEDSGFGHGTTTTSQHQTPFQQNGESDDDEHPELGDLRNALTKSLASPGGVEMDENPVHNGAAGLDDVSRGLQEASNAKGEFPSERPAHEPGHASSASFARTVPRDVDWGEDDEFDPDWNFQRADTDPFQMMPASDRTNSFPQVPSIHNSSNPASNYEVQKSQTEDIMAGSGKTFEFFASDVENDDFSDQVAGISELKEGGDADSLAEPTFESRFEEGIPLMGHSKPSPLTSEDAGVVSPDPFTDTDPHTEDDFFGRIAASGETVEHPSLDRKSTMQVINSIGLHPSKPGNTEIPGAVSSQAWRNSENAFDIAPDGGIAVSRSPGLSQARLEPSVDFDSGNKDHAQNAGEPSAEDLAAQWKAALDGDELLDEDDLLGEEAGPEANLADPAALFGSDDEGFLDDDDEHAAYGNTLSDDTSSPLQVVGNSRHTVEFDNPAHSVHDPQNNSNRRYIPPNASQTPAQPLSNAYAPQGSLLTDLSTQSARSPIPYGVGTGHATAPIQTSYHAPQQKRPDPLKSQSFADKSKGGYASPYDLPMDVVKPRKRASMQHIARGYNNAPFASAVLPPRSSSMATQGPPPSSGSGSSLSPPISSPSLSQLPSKPPHLPTPARQSGASTSTAKGSFFEDLPITSRPQPTGRYTPQPSPIIPNDHGIFVNQPPIQGTDSQASQYSAIAQGSQSPPVAHGLVAPPRASPYASLPPTHTQPPVPTSRYSPAPVRSSSGGAPPPHPSHGRYAAAPSLQQQQSSSSARSNGSASSPPPPILPHQPRTSSPLIHFERAQDQQPYGDQAQTSDNASMFRRESSGLDQGPRYVNLPTTQELDENGPVQEGHGAGATYDQQPGREPSSKAPYNMPEIGAPVPPNNYQPVKYSEQVNLPSSKRTTSSSVPGHQQSSVNPGPHIAPPVRSQTQSPSKVMAGPRIDSRFVESSRRPSSAHGPTSTRQVEQYSAMAGPNIRTRTRGFSQEVNYIAPTDGRELDPLQRWRGGPVFAWGVGGTVFTSFPKQVPRYGVSQTIPMVICSPGEITIRSVKDLFPLEDRLSSFPGPLKGKSRKKYLTNWLTAGIDVLERDTTSFRSIPTLTYEDKRKEERVLLWKILRVMVENDGILEGNANVNNAVRLVLTPGLDGDQSVAAPQYTIGADLPGISRAPTSTVKPEPVDPASVDELRNYLLQGEREKAVWEAVDKRLWAHALLISNTLSKEIHKQVAQEFIQKEVKSIGENTESLAALYEVFAGNFEESVDELVPPSARAGFQMVSTTGSPGQTKRSIDGLDRWRETLGLILSNRSPEDSQAINALGKLLSGYGRTEAAHICFLFARGYSLFGGMDDPASNIVLVGSDHMQQPNEFDKDLEPILLSEVYEYGLSISSASNVTFSAPHLAAYKLQHANVLAQSGQRDKALQYCEAIASSITSQVRRSAYHHTLLVSALDDLSKRLKQSPKDESSTWISKPSVEKISGSVWAKFNKFVAGDENYAASGPGSDAGSEIGPFARIAGDTPILSRSPSNSDIYGPFNGAPVNGNFPHPAPLKSTSQYAPRTIYGPSSAQDSLSSSYRSPPRENFLNGSLIDEIRRQRPEDIDRGSSIQLMAPNDQVSKSYPISTQGTPYNPHSPLGFHHPGGSPTLQPPTAPAYEQHTPLSSNDSPRSIPISEGDYSTAGYVPPASSYEPPSSGGYEPPSYEPATMNDELDFPVDTRPKMNRFTDDDYEPQMTNATESTPALSSKTEKTKAEKDREADEAFRKAAEADAQKDAQAAPTKRGWGLGGWFAKKETPSDTTQPNKPVRAKLGEESSFYYDPGLKRWVNKKAGNDGSSESPSATPPPPRAGPPRTATASSGEPIPTARPFANSAPPQRAASALVTSNPSQSFEGPGGLSVPPGSLPMSRSVSNGSAAGPPSGPPSRPTTSMSNASSIDDLLGPPTSRKGTAKKAKKGRGYIDVMGEKTNT